MKRGLIGAAVLIGGVAMSGGGAEAGPYPPFYGYSPYFGSPAPYFTHDTDVRSASTISSGLPGNGTRVYYQGGPFYHMEPAPRAAYGPRHSRRRVVLRRRG